MKSEIQMPSMPRVRSMIYGQPWLISEAYLETIAEVFERRIYTGEKIVVEDEREEGNVERIGNVDVIQCNGVISRRMNMFSAISGGASIDALRLGLREAMASDSRAALFHFDSPGGAVGGGFEFAREIYEARMSGIKPVIALVDGNCCSLAYLFASQCETIYATEASAIGNIGVVGKIDDYSRGEKNAGNDPVVVRSHPNKGIGVGPITPAQAQVLQARCNEYAGMFKSAVMRGRGSLLKTEDDGELVLDYIGMKAVEIGLVDSIATLEELISEFA